MFHLLYFSRSIRNILFIEGGDCVLGLRFRDIYPPSNVSVHRRSDSFVYHPHYRRWVSFPGRVLCSRANFRKIAAIRNFLRGCSISKKKPFLFIISYQHSPLNIPPTKPNLNQKTTFCNTLGPLTLRTHPIPRLPEFVRCLKGIHLYKLAWG